MTPPLRSVEHQVFVGAIKKLNEKGYGFISPADKSKDIFFHANDIVSGSFSSLCEGDTVSFELGDSPKGPKATCIYTFLGEVFEPEEVNLTPEEVIAAWKLPADHEARLIETDFRAIRVVQDIMRDPELMHRLDPRQFEHVIAEFLSLHGFQHIVLTPRSGDGGKDIIASMNVAGFPVGFYFECKHHGKGRPVDIVELRALVGVVKGRESTAAMGVFMTTGRFTKGGRKYIASEAQVRGKDYDDLVGWIRKLKV